jgi:UDP-N-acetylglucosamine 2-epimerase (non-hydrolysing)
MIDSYELVRGRIEQERAVEALGLTPQGFGVVTLHRPANVDDEAVLSRIVAELSAVADRLPLVFAIHPRTRKQLERFGLLDRVTGAKAIRVVEPMGYIRFMALVSKSRLVITDSGGVQEETTYLDIPCLTLRDTTERPITVLQGSNRLVAPDALASSVGAVFDGTWPHGRKPALWDGHTAERVVDNLRRACGL